MMKDANYWEKFVTTGKVEDYLHYRINADGMTSDGGSARDLKSASFAASYRAQETDRKRRVAFDAGSRGSDRDRFEG